LFSAVPREHLIENYGAKGCGANPPIVKAPNLSVRSPAPAVSTAATVIRFRGLEKSTLFSTQIRPAMAAIRPNSTIDKPPMTGPGIERIRAPNFGEKREIVLRGDPEVPPVAYDVIDPQPLLRLRWPGPARSFFSDRSTPVTLTAPCWRIIRV